MGISTIRVRLLVALVAMAIVVFGFLPTSSAQETAGEFSIQVTPSPLVFSAKPGTPTTVELKIRNTGPQAEELKIEPRSFRLNQLSGEVTLVDEPPREVTDWITFSDPVFTIQPGQWFKQSVTFSPPESAGFSYSFVLQISRTQDPVADEGERALKGTVAVFTLINIDRPDATKKLEITSFGTNKNVYEYLPVLFTTTLRNTGNTILQPYGNIFIQRNADDEEPITSLPFNEQRGYILPGTTRSLTNVWDDGFPVYTDTSSGGKTTQQLSWNWNNINDLRVGNYTAKLVAVYNDGTRDIPLQATVQFWVLPWKFILAGVAIFAVFAFGVWSMFGRFLRFIQKKTPKQKRKNKPQPPHDDDSDGTKINVRIGK